MAKSFADKARPCMGASKFTEADITRLEDRVRKLKAEHEFDDENHAYIEAAARIATEARKSKALILSALDKEDAGKAPREPAPAAEAPAKKFDNLPDLADAIAKENKLPKGVADAYTQAVVLGRPHAAVAQELGVGKSTVGDWTRQMTKLVDEAKGERLDRSGDTVEVERHEPSETVAPEDKATSEAPSEKAQEPPTEHLADQEGDQTGETHAETRDSGDLVDEDNHNPYQGDADLSDADGNVNITTDPHGKGKTSADNNISADRLKSLTKKWDQLNMTVPAEQRIDFKNLGSAQQDAFDAEARKGDAGARRAHAAIWPGAHQGEKFNKADPYAGSHGIESKLGRVTSADSDVRAAMRSAHAFDAVASATRDTYVAQNGETLQLEPVRAEHTQPLAVAIVGLTQHAEEGREFYKHALNGVDQIVVFTAPQSGGMNRADAFFGSSRNLIAVNATGSLLDAHEARNDRASAANLESTVAHELVHAADDAAARWAGINDGMLSATAQSRTFTMLGVQADGTLETKHGTVANEAYTLFRALRETAENLSPEGELMAERLAYALGPLADHEDILRASTPAQRFSTYLDKLDGENGINSAELHASTELGSVLLQVRAEHPDVLEKALPLGYAHAGNIQKAASDQAVHNSILEEQHARLADDQTRSPGQAAPARAENQSVRGRPAPREDVPAKIRVSPVEADARAAAGAQQSSGSSAQERRPAGAEKAKPRPGDLGGLAQALPALDKPGGIKAFARSVVGDKLYRNFPSLLGALSTEQLADRFAEHPLVQKFSDAMSKMGGLANHLIGEANPVIRDWAKVSKMLGAEKSNEFGKLLLDSTTKGMWPNKEFGDPAHDHLKPGSLDPKIATPQQIAERSAQLDKLRAEHAALAAQWNRLPTAFQDLFPRIEAVNRNNFDRHVAADRKVIIDSYHPALEDAAGPRAETINAAAEVEGARDRKAFVADNKLDAVGEKRVKELWESLDSHRSDYDNRLAGPYFPKSRFGEHIVSYKSPEFNRAELAVQTAKAALDQAKDGAHAGERAELEQEVAVTRRKLDRATALDSVARHTADLKDAETRLAALDVGTTAAKATLQERTTALNDLKANDSHYAVEFHENREVAKQRAAQLEAFFAGDGTTVERSTRDVFLSKADGATPAYMNRIADHLVGSLTGAQAEEVRRTVREMHITHLPGSSALKSQLKRRDVPGVKVEEVQRAFATKAVKDAYAISRKTYMGELHENTNALRYGDDKNEDAKLLGNELAKRIALNASLKTNAAISFATNATYFAQLGMSPGFMLQQATQQWVNTAPMMAARHGVGTATRELAKGTADAAKIMKVSFDKSKSKMTFDIDTEAAVKAGTITEHEAAMLRDMISRGTIDISSSHDAGIAAGGGEMDTLSRAAQMANWPVQQLEVLNRVSTALGGFRAELAKGVKEGGDFAKTNDRAIKYAEKLVSETHMNYASENRARFIHPNSWGGWGRVMFQFRAYQQGMAYLTAKNILDGVRGDKEAMKAAAYMTGMQLSTAGLAGMPIPGAMVAVAHLLYSAFTDDDEEKDPKEMFFQGLKSVGGEAFATMVTKGVPAALGVDLSGKLGAGNTFDVAPFVRNQKDGRDLTAAYFMSIVGGAAGGQVANIAEAMHQASKGEFAKAAMMLPGKAITDIIKAEEYQRVGTKDSRGNQILSPEDISTASTIIKALGLQPTELGRVQDERTAFFAARQSRNDARAKLLTDYARAKIAGEDTGDIMEAIQGFNSRHHDDRIAMGALPVAVQKHREQMRNMRNGVPVGKRDRQLYEDVLGE